MELVRGKKLKQIFQDHWSTYVKLHPHLRPAIYLNVDKFLKCGTGALGFHLYQCPSCGQQKKVPHTCKSRFCTSCGVAQTDQWIEQYTTLFANSQYQHLVFHPPSQFRIYFAIGRKPYFNALYSAVNLTLKAWYTRQAYLPGIMNVSHTFGRALNFTPHLHTLITCGGLHQTQTAWLPCDFIPHQFLKYHFKLNFLHTFKSVWIKQQIDKFPPSLRYLFTKPYLPKIVTPLLKLTWYVYIGRRLSNATFTVRYIGRYTKRPAIAESRVTKYDGHYVTFTYQDHATQKTIIATLPVLKFISRVVCHIPDLHFRIIRYSGFYANRVRGQLLPRVFALLGQDYHQAQQHLSSLTSWWRTQIANFTQLDPLVCQLCFLPLDLIMVTYPNKAGSLIVKTYPSSSPRASPYA